MAGAGQLVVAGPLEDAGDPRGAFAFDVGSLEPARARAEADPAVKAGRLRVDVYKWWGGQGRPAAAQEVARQRRRASSNDLSRNFVNSPIPAGV